MLVNRLTLTQFEMQAVSLTLTLLTWTKWWARASASKWRMGFNSAFKGLIHRFNFIIMKVVK